ncbi:MAG: universal stress protein [Flammeovirgaceae bacterium]
MKKILFPTDFSDHANNAFDFAAKITEALGGELVILHTYRTPLDYHIPAHMIEKMAEDEHKTVTRILEKTIENYQTENPDAKAKMKMTPLAVQGFTSEIIIKSAETYEIDLIVMGTKGATGLEKIILGSMTATVIDQASCPVLAIPLEAKFTGFKQLIYASDFSPHDFNSIQKLRTFATNFDAKIHCIHVSDDENYFIDDVSFDLMRDNYFREYPDAEGKVDFHVLLGEDLEDGLKDAVDTYNAGLIAMTTRKESFLERLFSGSDTKNMAYHTKIPLLAFHE